MNNELREFLRSYMERGGFKYDSLVELLHDMPFIYREETSTHRWWNEYFYVVNVDGRLVGFTYAEANRDESVSDLGYSPDENSICNVKEIQKVITVYEGDKDE